MFGALYLGTTLSSWLLYGVAAFGMASRLNREGYKIVKDKKSPAEKLVDITKTLFIMSIPALNLLVSCISLFKFDEIYDEIKSSYILSGRIVKKEEQKKSEETDSVKIDLQTKEMNNSKKYSELTNEEKLDLLEDEKKRLLREKEFSQRTSESYNSRGAYSKRYNQTK